MRLRKANAGGSHLGELPLTSMIDVVFLLLIYFLVTLSMNVGEASLASTLKTDPKGGGHAADLQPQVLHVERGPEGGTVFRIGQRLVTSRDGLTSLLRQLPREGGVVVRVRGDASVEGAAAAQQACKDAGFTRISYVPAE